MQINFEIKPLFEGLLNVVYPLNCLICKTKLTSHQFNPLCFSCFREIKKNRPPFCSKCGKSLVTEIIPLNLCVDCKRTDFYFDRAWASTLYEGMMRDLIHQFKYSHKLSLTNIFSRILIDFCQNYLDIKKFDYILAIPLHRRKLREREFNQAELLAQPLAKNFKKSLLLKNIYRRRYSLPQSELNSQERYENVRGAFGIRNPAQIKDKNILIVDDIFTTGATVNECAFLLKKNGARIVEVLTLAR